MWVGRDRGPHLGEARGGAQPRAAACGRSAKCAPSMGANSWSGSPRGRADLYSSFARITTSRRQGQVPRGLVRRKPECKRYEATDGKPHIKVEGGEAGWQMAAMRAGTPPTVNAALVRRRFALRERTSASGPTCRTAHCRPAWRVAWPLGPNTPATRSDSRLFAARALEQASFRPPARTCEAWPMTASACRWQELFPAARPRAAAFPFALPPVPG